MSVHQLPDGRWICTIPKGTLPGQTKQVKEYFGRGDDGERKARDRNLELGIGVPVARRVSSISFGELATEYLDAKERSATEATIESLRYKMSRVILPILGDLNAHEVDHRALDRFVESRQKQGVKNRTIRDDLAYIKATLNYGVKEQKIAASYATNYTPPRNDQARIRPPSKEELQAIVDHAAPHIVRAIWIAYYTGCRPGPKELFSLTWRDVDFFAKAITITSAEKGGLASREIDLAPKFLELLKKWRQEDEESGLPVKYLIHYAGGPVNSIRKGFEAAMRRAGITRRIRRYDLRHMTATEMLAAGVPLVTVSEILGHKSIVQTADTYSHVRSPEKRNAVEKL